MDQAIKFPQYAPEESAFRKWWNSRSYVQQRLIRFCASMLVMVLCFPLYYLGLFGSVDGPLHPARIGEHLAVMGVTRTHSMALFLTFLIFAVSWNWIFNLISLLIGARLTCKRAIEGSGHICAAAVKRQMAVNKRNGAKITQYICSKGHKRPEAHFHPLRKGTVSHSVWLISLAFCIIVFFMT